jgi:hypothetical protein
MHGLALGASQALLLALCLFKSIASARPSAQEGATEPDPSLAFATTLNGQQFINKVRRSLSLL